MSVRNFLQRETKKLRKKKLRIPRIDDIRREIVADLRSKYPPILLGRGEKESLYLTLEDWEHLHVMGTTGEGKSRFLEYLICKLIKRQQGVCFFDPSDHGDTIRRILNYCAKINHPRVLLIDPYQRESHNKVCTINPLWGKKSAAVSVVSESLRILYEQKDWSDTPIIRKYLSAILSVLHNAGLPLSDVKYFRNEKLIADRMKILAKSPEDDIDRLDIESAYKNPKLFVEYQSTVRRLKEINQEALDLMFGWRERGVNFNNLITQKWVVLVNMYPWAGFDLMHTRLRGTMIIHLLINALDNLTYPHRKTKDGKEKKPWKGRYYLFVDEAGRFITRDTADTREKVVLDL